MCLKLWKISHELLNIIADYIYWDRSDLSLLCMNACQAHISSTYFLFWPFDKWARTPNSTVIPTCNPRCDNDINTPVNKKISEPTYVVGVCGGAVG